MKFVKMQGAGNDFILLDCLNGWMPPNPSALASQLCRRHFSIGADGIVLIKPSDTGDFFMDIWNADGSRAGMCGNATRCTARYLYEQGLLSGSTLQLETLDGIKEVQLNLKEGQLTDITVNLGTPRWDPETIPVKVPSAPVLDHPLEIEGQTFLIHAVSMGNPHCVIFTDNLDDDFIGTWGPRLEKHPLFPDRCNVEFVKPAGENRVSVRVWERGCGETLACGTGAAAVCSVLHKKGMLSGPLECQMPGGLLIMEYVRGTRDDHILKTGPAVTVYEGLFDPERFHE